MNLQTLTAERDRLDTLRDSGRFGPTELRSIAAKRAHLTRKINAAGAAESLATAPTVAPVLTRDPAAPMSSAQIVAETRAMLAEHGLAGWTVKVSNLLTSTYGKCDHRKREIRIAGPIAKLNPAAETRDTIAHEVAHALAGPGKGHGPEWKRMCAVTGATPKRCHSAKTPPKQARYEGTCVPCGRVVATRKVAVKAGSSYRHVRCGGEITWRDLRA